MNLNKKLISSIAAGICASMFFSQTALAAPKFNPIYYAAQNPDVVALVGNDANALEEHYKKYGKNEGRMANQNDCLAMFKKMFNASYYAAMNPKVVALVGNDPIALFNHYMTYGIWEGISPNPYFSPAAAKELANQITSLLGDNYREGTNLANILSTVVNQGNVEARNLISNMTLISTVVASGVAVSDPKSITNITVADTIFSFQNTIVAFDNAVKTAAAKENKTQKENNDKPKVESFNDFVASVPTPNINMSKTAYQSSVNSWIARGKSLGYITVNEGRNYVLSGTAMYDVIAYTNECVDWLNDKPSKEKYLAGTTYAADHANWENNKPKNADYYYDKTAYEAALANWQANMPIANDEWQNSKPKKSDFYGAQGEFDESNYNAAVATWNAQKPDANSYLTAEQRNQFTLDHNTWNNNKPSQGNYVYNSTWYDNEAAAAEVFNKDKSDYNTLMNKTIRYINTYFIDGQEYGTDDAAMDAFAVYKDRMDQYLQIQNSTLDNYIDEDTCEYTFAGYKFKSKANAVDEFKTYVKHQKIHHSSVSDYYSLIDTYEFGEFREYKFDQSDSENAQKTFDEWCARQKKIIAQSNITTDINDYDNYKQSSLYIELGDEYYSVDTPNIREIIDDYNRREGSDHSLEGLERGELWIIPADSSGLNHDLVIFLDIYSSNKSESFARRIESVRVTGVEDDAYEVSAERNNGTAIISDFARTRDSWYINGEEYTSEEDAKTALDTYKKNLYYKKDDYYSESLKDYISKKSYVIGEGAPTSEDKSEELAAALSEYKNNHPVDEGYSNTNTVSNYITNTVYDYEGSNVIYDTYEAAARVLDAAKAAAVDPDFTDEKYKFNTYSSTEDANNAYNADLEQYLGANDEPTIYSYVNAEYFEDKNNWESSSPSESDYTFDALDSEAFESAKEDYITENPEPTEQNYLIGYDEESEMSEWEDKKPEKEDFVATSEDSNNSENGNEE